MFDRGISQKKKYIMSVIKFAQSPKQHLCCNCEMSQNTNFEGQSLVSIKIILLGHKRSPTIWLLEQKKVSKTFEI